MTVATRPTPRGFVVAAWAIPSGFIVVVTIVWLGVIVADGWGASASAPVVAIVGAAVLVLIWCGITATATRASGWLLALRILLCVVLPLLAGVGLLYTNASYAQPV